MSVMSKYKKLTSQLGTPVPEPGKYMKWPSAVKLLRKKRKDVSDSNEQLARQIPPIATQRKMDTQLGGTDE